MPEKNSRHLLDRLAEIQDPRNDKGKRHPLNSILALSIRHYYELNSRSFITPGSEV